MEIYLYRVKMNHKINEIVLPCIDGYTVYIDDSLDDVHALKAYRHALTHIHRGDCDVVQDVNRIEYEAHRDKWACRKEE
ncbi:MAG: hypothetical protein ACI4W2_00120 [Eubacterium sp.]